MTKTDKCGQKRTNPDTIIFTDSTLAENKTKKLTIMNQTKTAVILSIVTLVLVGAVIYALRDNFSSKKENAVIAPAQ